MGLCGEIKAVILQQCRRTLEVQTKLLFSRSPINMNVSTCFILGLSSLNDGIMPVLTLVVNIWQLCSYTVFDYGVLRMHVDAFCPDSIEAMNRVLSICLVFPYSSVRLIIFTCHSGLDTAAHDKMNGQFEVYHSN